MRTIVDLPEDQIQALDSMGEKYDLSRAELVRRAVADYLEGESKAAKSKLDQYYGILKGNPTAFDGLDGLSWQKRMRAESDDREADMDRRLSENRSLSDQKQAGYRGPSNTPDNKKGKGREK